MYDVDTIRTMNDSAAERALAKPERDAADARRAELDRERVLALRESNLARLRQNRKFSRGS